MSRLRTQFPTLYRFAAFLALFAILVPVATTLVHHPQAAQAFVHICGAAQNNNTGKDAPHKLPSCPICQGLHLLANGYVPPTPMVFTGAQPFIVTHVAQFSVLHVAFPVAPQARPRAPPVFA